MKTKHTVTIEGESLEEVKRILGTKTYKETVQQLVDKAAVYSDLDQIFKEIQYQTRKDL